MRIDTADVYYQMCQIEIDSWFSKRKLNIDLSACKPITRTWHEKMYNILQPTRRR
jgi:hypothetical protein